MKPSQNRWDDHYARRAKKEKFAARSVYKLDEIQKKQRIITKGDHVLDLGCSPGSWLQFAARHTGPSGRVVGIDLKAVTIDLPGHVETYIGDLRDLDPGLHQVLAPGFHVVLSDMAPATSGSKHADAARSSALCRAALETADMVLRPGGRFVCKIFQGEDFKPFCDTVKLRFKSMRIFKPQSSRKTSREIFIIGIGKRQEANHVRS